MYKNMRKRGNIVLHGVVHAVDQGKDAHQQVQPLPDLQEHAFRNIYSLFCCDECIEYLCL